MSTMLMAPRTRANTAHAVGVGGRRCACCDAAPKHNKRVRRGVKRSERSAWRRDVR